MLVLGRVLQGLAAALMAPQSLALIRASLDGRDQTAALGLHGATVGLAAVIGQSLGGLLVTADVWGLGWRAIFLINLPVAALALVGSLFLRDPHTRGAERLDWGGALLLFAGLAGLVVPLLVGQDLGGPGGASRRSRSRPACSTGSGGASPPSRTTGRAVEASRP